MTLRKCVGCCEELSKESFSWKNKQKGTLQSRCKSCYNTYNREHYAKSDKQPVIDRSNRNNKKLWQRYKDWKLTQQCCICGESSPECLDLHHVDPAIKDGNIGDIVSKYNWQKVLAEIAKCVVVCANCHRKIHSGRIASPPLISAGTPPVFETGES